MAIIELSEELKGKGIDYVACIQHLVSLVGLRKLLR